ncbi:elongation factor Tu EF-Tu-like protein [Klosneuvirus KNV1]|uniref:Elongation factor Tu EF-Tu-like protein n=1 Tax=Klosneuvirus KNV1 TaxID=1977640 RepID=A0A1V0SJN4_9VIRU|nr:elongation factor Tu EF-Tu-like protein [Klosneuvirus KNV1]
MDSCNYSKDRFDEIKAEVSSMLVQVGWNKDFVKNSVAFIPYSAWKGDNITKQSTNMPWYTGSDVKCLDGTTTHVHTLLDAFNNYVKVPKRVIDAPSRMPVSQVLQLKGIGDVICGKIEQGVFRPNDEVIFLPQHTEANPCAGRIFSIEMHHTSQDSASCGDNVGVNIKGLNKKYMPKHGSVMVLKTDKTIGAAKRFVSQVQILEHPGELKVGFTPIALIKTARAAVKLVEIKWKQGKETGGKKLENPASVKENEIAEIVWEPQAPFVVEAFDKCEGFGRVAIFDSSICVMMGRVISVEY